MQCPPTLNKVAFPEKGMFTPSVCLCFHAHQWLPFKTDLNEIRNT